MIDHLCSRSTAAVAISFRLISLYIEFGNNIFKRQPSLNYPPYQEGYFESRSKAPVEWGERHDSNPGGSRYGAHQTRTQTRAQGNPQPEVVNGSQPRVVALERVQK
ncbi:hypothetical protein HAX54_037380 [Datura stramonium]|uniref:Uncharacterized protein n=1 Tax=Datura stramonium TaxID=4076 RepID=A0ABS8VI91_DATST|nr:hypothetical protein [Datura stramonium]